LTLALLQLTHWGTRFEEIRWLTAPNENRVNAAKSKCQMWHAIENDQLTEHGSAMLRSGLEPWLAHFVVLSETKNCLLAAICFAATLTINPERITERMHQSTLPKHPEVLKEAQRLCARLGIKLTEPFNPIDPTTLIQAFSQRLIFAPKQQTPKLANGAAVTFVNHISSEWSLMLNGQGTEQGIRIFDALELNKSDVINTIETNKSVEFRPEHKTQNFWLVETFDALVLSEKPVNPDQTQKVKAWQDYIKRKGQNALPKNTEIMSLEQRWRMAQQHLEDWPLWPNEADWFDIAEPFLSGLTALSSLDTLAALKHWLGYNYLSKIDEHCPKSWTCPSGRLIELNYQPSHDKVIATLKLQEAFGLTQQPCVAKTQPITLDLTAPNGRPVASVTDISFFWIEVYPQVRKELRGRYAKHPWPEDPLTSIATSKTKRQLNT
jgi:ATP-dependent helicase HrpB